MDLSIHGLVVFFVESLSVHTRIIEWNWRQYWSMCSMDYTSWIYLPCCNPVLLDSFANTCRITDQLVCVELPKQ